MLVSGHGGSDTVKDSERSDMYYVKNMYVYTYVKINKWFQSSGINTQLVQVR